MIVGAEPIGPFDGRGPPAERKVPFARDGHPPGRLKLNATGERVKSVPPVVNSEVPLFVKHSRPHLM